LILVGTPPPPSASVIIPIVNEEQDIEQCLSAVFSQEYDPELVELIVIDGGSTDRSKEVAAAAFARSPFARNELLPNTGGNTPSNLNRGLAAAHGDIVVRVDARSVIPADYVSRAVDILENRPEVVVVGGAQIPRARPDSGMMAQAIARALRNPYLTGLSRYRLRERSGPSDTVYLGAFRRSELNRVGGWNEAFGTNQDYELNRRMALLGTVWFESSLQVVYRPRETLRALGAQYRRFGRWKAAAWLEAGAMSRRHAAILTAAALGLFFFPRWVLGRPAPRGAIALAAALRLEATVGEPGGPAVRILALAANGTSTVAWLVGVIEQAIRFSLGLRLIQRG